MYEPIDMNDHNHYEKEDIRVGKPSFEKYLTTTYSDGFSIRMRFDNGGDIKQNMSCTVHWKAYPKKPSSTPTVSDLTKNESMRIYASTSGSTTFDKSHAGFIEGTYIYYCATCSNSKYSVTTPVTFCIIR
jgi:hypothetical protein